MRLSVLAATLLVLGASAGIGCTESPKRSSVPVMQPDAGAAADASTSCTPNTMTCRSGSAQVCDENGELQTIDCAASGRVCDSALGCVECSPNQSTCDGNRPQTCRADGSGWEVGQACDSDAGLSCDLSRGTCVNLCEQAEADKSYIGCEYWPRVTATSVAPEFDFAVVVSNPQAVAAEVVIDRGGDATDAVVDTVTIPAGGVETIPLPWHDPLRIDSVSLRAANASYRLASSVPVTVYQFSPLQYRLARDCSSDLEAELGDDQCFSYSNDASLLLPTHVLTGDYLVLSWPSLATFELAWDPQGTPVSLSEDEEGGERLGKARGFVSIAGVADDPVTVEVTFAAYTEAFVQAPTDDLASIDTQSSEPGYSPGESGTFTLERGDVLQITSQVPTLDPSCEGSSERYGIASAPGYEFEHRFCDLGRDYDLSGTRIHASGPISVMAGHSCAFVPYDRFACDHLEESMFPLQTWGTRFVVGRTKPLRGEPNIVRVMAATDGTTLEFDPVVHPTTTLDAGEYVEFESDKSFIVEGSAPLAVGQYLVGQQFNAELTSQSQDQDQEAAGDPAFGLVAPTDQYRRRYDFLVPDTYDASWITVVATENVEVLLDGEAISGWQTVGDSNMRSTNVQVDSGAHQMSGSWDFGVTVYGFGSFTSYMYTAGLDLQEIFELE